MLFDLAMSRLLCAVLQKARQQANPHNVKTTEPSPVQDLETERREKIKAQALRRRRTAKAREAQTTATNSDWDDEGGWDDAGGRSSNHDRSDSMNPNNDAYDAAMDNHANQMNPNNDAYHSSRGR